MSTWKRPIVPRVLPLLTHDLVEATPATQCLHLLAFLENIPILHASVVTAEDAHDLLIVLFYLAWNKQQDSTTITEVSTLTLDSTKGATTCRLPLPLEVANLAFSVICAIFAQELAHFRVFLAAITTLLRRLGCEASAIEKEPASEPIAKLLVEPGMCQISRQQLNLQSYLDSAATRVFAVRLLETLDLSGVAVEPLCDPLCLHMFLPHRVTGRAHVYRDFVTCSRRHRQPKPRPHPSAFVHIKTSIPARSAIRYRFLVEGYNYGTNAAIRSEIGGYTHRDHAQLGRMEEQGWPAGWDSACAVDHAAGARISQYYSTDGFVVIKLAAESFFNAGFSVSAWLVHHDNSALCLTAKVFHQDGDL
eukprot:TRINITY_DN71699_c0_g1_i1.p1 TRINITY_DN71699_c0_g1~~TRINITY_DN71699_c0_g1_i1.p1  ORF type:complete len:362 (-),score=38.52 TRINITY_DN71699_c0_g1_i1:20-1105(-)